MYIKCILKQKYLFKDRLRNARHTKLFQGKNICLDRKPDSELISNASDKRHIFNFFFTCRKSLYMRDMQLS